MFASTAYHLYIPLSEKVMLTMLKIDLVGIGLMIFGLTLCSVYVGFHNWPTERATIMTMMSCLLLLNILFQMTPCYIKPEYETHRIVFYVFTLIICGGLAVSARLFFGTAGEIE